MNSIRGASQSVEYSGNKTFPANNRRNYFFVVMSGGSDGTIEFGGGGGKIPIPADSFYEPLMCSLSEIKVECTGTYVVHTDAETHSQAK
ncbi:hypothetical protein VPHK436_0062 [Vibrio phage K436]